MYTCEAGAGDEAATVQRYAYGYEEVSTPYLMPCVSAINAAERAQEVSDQTQRRMLEGPLLLTSTPYARRIYGSHCVFGKCSPLTRLASQLQVRFSPPGGVHCRPISNPCKHIHHILHRTVHGYSPVLYNSVQGMLGQSPNLVVS